MIVQVIKEVPDNIFNKCLDELLTIKWELVVDERKVGVFATSTAIHIRSPNTLKSHQTTDSIYLHTEIIDCVDNKRIVQRFPAHYRAVEWIKEQVNGISIGRIMIVRLDPNGAIGLHADPGIYFKKYSRYHIPFKTNKHIQFFDKHNNKEHMPIKTLCRLNNLDYHGLLNESNEDRIHLIVDIEVAGGNTVF